MDHRLGHEQAALHAARQRAARRVGLVGEGDGGQQRVRHALRLRHAVEAGLQLQGLAGREEGVEQNLLRHDADRPLRVPGMLVDVESQIDARPLVLFTSPAKMLISVDLPAPFGPSSPKIDPRGTSKLTSSSARLPPA